MFKLILPFTSRDGVYFSRGAVVGDSIDFRTEELTALTTTIIDQPAGSALTTTDGAKGSTLGPLTTPGIHVVTVTSSASGYTLTAKICVWSAAIIADGGPLTYRSYAGQSAANKTDEQKRRQILNSMANAIGQGAPDANFALTNDVFPGMNPVQYGL